MGDRLVGDGAGTEEGGGLFSRQYVSREFVVQFRADSTTHVPGPKQPTMYCDGVKDEFKVGELANRCAALSHEYLREIHP